MIVYTTDDLDVDQFLTVDQFILHGEFDIDAWLDYLLALIEVYEQK